MCPEIDKSHSGDGYRLVSRIVQGESKLVKTEPVLISFSIVVNAPVSESVQFNATLDHVQEKFLSAVAVKIRACLETLKEEPWFDEEEGVLFNYLSSENLVAEENVGRCVRCNRWSSYMEKPHFLRTIHWGNTVNGQLICLECDRFGDNNQFPKVEFTEIPTQYFSDSQSSTQSPVTPRD